ncbi:carbohydrate ABC transporter permease [Chloroflexi bacterium TSY]|nr:carbohydrate ABC transporter permease [Chloroflexi bacterium TSY]
MNAPIANVWPPLKLGIAVTILLVVLAVFLFPFFWMISSSLKTLAEVSTFPPPILPETPQWQNYVTAFSRAPLLQYGWNTIIVAVAVIVLTVTLTVMAAYALVFLEFRGKNLVFLILLSPQMVAGVILLLPLFVVLLQFKMLNTYWSLIIPYTVLFAPFAVMLLRGYLETIPRDLVEAARVDGATEVWTLFRVIFPLARPALATVALFCFIWSWNEFLFALVYIQKPALRTISVGIALLESMPNFPRETNIILAASAAITLPVLILFTVAQRQFIEGITAGSVK